MSSNYVIILAAGNGTRLKSNSPKILQEIGGLSMLDHIISAADKINPEKIIVVTKNDFPSEKLVYGDYVSIVVQNFPRGTGDAVKCALPEIDFENPGWVYVLYGDIPLISSKTLEKLAEIGNRDCKTGVVVLAMFSGNHKDLGKLELADGDGTIKSIVEAKDAEKIQNCDLIPLCNSGLLIRKDVLQKLIDRIEPSKVTNEIYITEIVKLAYENGFNCRYLEGLCEELSGVNTCAELAEIERIYQNQLREKHMRNGVHLIAPETVFFSYDTEIEPSVTVHPYVVFLKNVKVKNGAVIGPFCVVEGSEIKNAQVGPFARLRSGSVLEEQSKIGNFVEIKNSTISGGAKVNHLSYIGDCFIGENTNIGAGTITCNYDGFKKHKTEIGNNVFIGSNSAIVAPLKIEDNALIGAGSTITKNVCKNDFAIARNRQTNYENGAVKFRNKIREK